ncbi:MAG TPA: hypothetical protein VKR06_46485 [Ktedonosporobacter sp.]|nr:hypothetical protein [Ktedonosporobacter sp.]
MSSIQSWVEATSDQQEVIISDDDLISITSTMADGQSGMLSLSSGLAVEEETKEGSN